MEAMDVRVEKLEGVLTVRGTREGGLVEEIRILGERMANLADMVELLGDDGGGQDNDEDGDGDEDAEGEVDVELYASDASAAQRSSADRPRAAVTARDSLAEIASSAQRTTRTKFSELFGSDDSEDENSTAENVQELFNNGRLYSTPSGKHTIQFLQLRGIERC